MIKILEKVQLTVGVLSLSIFFIAIIIQITTRHLGISMIWTEEVAKYSFIWSVFMGAAVMVNRREHFSFDFLVQKLKGTKKTALLIVIDTIVFLFTVALFYYGIEAVQNFWNYTWTSLPQLKMGYVWVVIPITGLTMAIYSLNHLIHHFKELKRGGAKA
ncbi:TRAP transporter small permease [Metabacillus iocasae]|uniref:TRAP-type C4-dicarboxylate transport system permease small subunit n=1 Tax=Priestia iocasae TaxID=2291674 RepID=A0ABS2QY41_9BACI|nr:TRAP transporter small permease [Metabacillus iocasae]MBM7704391.1 TRAP-type C4-dicarboxylate transport system permease small subunit [Metabacillus iocasae]